MKHINASTKEIKKFGITFSILSLVLTSLVFYKGSTWWPWWLAGSLIFLLTGLFLQPLLKPLYIGWMTFAFALGWVNTRIILGLVFYLAFTPIAIFLRLSRKDILGLRLNRNATTYWIKRKTTTFDKKRYEQLF